MSVPKLLEQSFLNNSKNKAYKNIDGTLDVQNIVKEKFSTDTYKVDNVIFGNGSKELLFMIQLVFDGVIFIYHHIGYLILNILKF